MADVDLGRARSMRSTIFDSSQAWALLTFGTRTRRIRNRVAGIFERRLDLPCSGKERKARGAEVLNALYRDGNLLCSPIADMLLLDTQKASYAGWNYILLQRQAGLQLIRRPTGRMRNVAFLAAIQAYEITLK